MQVINNKTTWVEATNKAKTITNITLQVPSVYTCMQTNALILATYLPAIMY